MPVSFPALVTILALVLYALAALHVGMMRARHNVRAPSTSGPPEFERAFRVHQNTQEQLVLFIPALWLFAMLVSPFWAGCIGLAWVAARVFYAYSYLRDPETRAAGFLLALACSVALLLGALAGALVNLV